VTIQTYSTADIKLTPRQRRREQSHFEKVRKAELTYSIQLRKIARQVGEIISHYQPADARILPEIQDLLNRYSHIIRPWAASTATRMIAEVARRDETAWQRHSAEINRGLIQEVRSAPIGDEVRRILQEQVHLITDIPIKAGEEMQALARKAYIAGDRYETIIPKIQAKVSGMTRNRATLIARTETAKTASAFVQARAKYIGADTYIWRTVRDADVRPAHKRLEGTVHSWDAPPIAEEGGQRHHPGEFPNCRCFSEPRIDDV
jgi:SPP1 gp7 family putative phage head morphogenesis protein